ncbi:MAG: choice-of-anchor Q domain-containing protein, partial [bacterium]
MKFPILRRMMMKRAIFSVVMLGIWGMRTYGADLYVPSQYATIQAGINAANDGDTVWVADGIYTGSGNKDLSWSGKHITVRSENGPENCIIDCENSGRGFYLADGQTNSDLILGLTIKNGYVVGEEPVGCGGGIFCYGSSPSVTNCIISGNQASVDGGGIACYNYSSPDITNCIIIGNQAYRNGGGVRCCNYSSPTIKNCIIRGNRTIFYPYNSYGGGIECNHSFPSITNCIITENFTAEDGGGIRCYAGSSPSITNCIIAWNNAGWGGGISSLGSSPSIDYNNLWSNGGGNYYECSAGLHDISTDPQFIGNGDFHLQPTSYCIDAGLNTALGIPEKDKDGNPRIMDGNEDGIAIVDMGAYEFPGDFLQIKQLFPSSGYVGCIVTISGNTSSTETTISIDFGTHLAITSTFSNEYGSFSATFIVNTQPSCTKVITASDEYGNLATTVFKLTGIPRISLEKQGPDQALTKSTITYTLIYKNTGNTELSDVLLIDTLPNGGTITFGIGSLNIEEEGSRTLEYYITELPAETITNRAIIEGRASSPCSEGTTSAIASCSTYIMGPRIELAKLAPIEVLTQSTITYTLIYKNIGTTELSDVFLIDYLPSEEDISFDIGSLNPGEEGSITIDYYITEPASSTI